jgi:HSP20 family protein
MANNLDITRDSSANLMSRTPSMLDFVPGFDDMMETFFGNRLNSVLNDWPVTETEQCYVLTAEVPGIPKEDIEISVNGNLLSIRAEHKDETAANTKGYRRQYRRFQQSFALPTTVDANQIEARYENGMLEVVLPKVAEAQAKRIEVKSGKSSEANRTITSDQAKPKEQSKH